MVKNVYQEQTDIILVEEFSKEIKKNAKIELYSET